MTEYYFSFAQKSGLLEVNDHKTPSDEALFSDQSLRGIKHWHMHHEFMNYTHWCQVGRVSKEIGVKNWK